MKWSCTLANLFILAQWKRVALQTELWDALAEVSRCRGDREHLAQ